MECCDRRNLTLHDLTITLFSLIISSIKGYIAMDMHDMTENSVEATVPRERSRKHRRVVFVTITIINGVLLVILGFALLTPAVNQSQVTVPTNSTLGDVHSSLAGKSAPDFALPTLTDSKVIV